MQEKNNWVHIIPDSKNQEAYLRRLKIDQYDWSENLEKHIFVKMFP